ncbi:hypothetical protein, partial [Desulfogranum marinum]|uniref:hypothetical protein n=1 Tax=Desulfogranum marinum TaxID=453220 RepID=UPI0019668BA6
PKTMAGIEWNPWPESIGMGGRNEMESPAGIPWNQWPDCSGILKQISFRTIRRKNIIISIG